ncbi:hypothetical protein C5S35_15550, partial [Candidatus Methanophagaceae archaeon]
MGKLFTGSSLSGFHEFTIKKHVKKLG